MVKRVTRKTPGQVPGLDFVDEIISTENAFNVGDFNSKKGGFLEEISKEIRSEKEEDLITISARVPRSLARKIREEAFSNELNVGSYLRKFLSHAFT